MIARGKKGEELLLTCEFWTNGDIYLVTHTQIYSKLTRAKPERHNPKLTIRKMLLEMLKEMK